MGHLMVVSATSTACSSDRQVRERVARRAAGLHAKYARNTPLANLFVSMLHGVGAPVKGFGDSTGELSGLK